MGCEYGLASEVLGELALHRDRNMRCCGALIR